MTNSINLFEGDRKEKKVDMVSSLVDSIAAMTAEGKVFTVRNGSASSVQRNRLYP